MRTSETINELASALAKAQAAMQGALKDSKNPFFKSNYADLQSVWDAIREPLTKNGLSVVQATEQAEDKIFIITRLLHSSGQWIEGRLQVMALKQEPQAVGSAITYARRYALAAITGCVQIDDDAESAQGRGETPKLDADHKIGKVTRDEPKPEKGNCEHTWFTSKFNPQEEYCSKCKTKRPKGSAA